jgi:D-alanyl-D-alanine carboxypeptidase
MAYIKRLAGGHSSGFLSRFVRSAVAAVALVAPITQPSAIAQAPNQDLVVTVDAVVEAVRSARSIPGVPVVITRGDEVLIAKGFGFADVESALPITPSTVFQIGSTSKQFTAAAVMKLVEMGRCSLDDSIVDLLPGLSPDWRDVRLRHLLHQTSGVPDFLFHPKFAEMDREPSSSADELRALIVQQPLQFQPGTRWAYSNSNYTLLAALIEKLGGKPYEQFLQEQFFARLGLRSIHECLPQHQAANEARGYIVRDKKVRRAPLENLNLARGDGSLCGSAEDLAQWANALANGKVVTPASYEQMSTAAPVRNGYTPPYGFAVSLLALSSQHPKVSHHGAMFGFTGMLSHYPKQDTTVALLTNRGGLWADGIEEAIARKVFGLPDVRPRDVATSKAERRRYAGNYDVGPFTAQISAEADGRLWLRTPRPGPTAALLFQGAHRFVSASDPEAIGVTFECSKSTCNRIRFRMAGMTWYGDRIDAHSRTLQTN